MNLSLKNRIHRLERLNRCRAFLVHVLFTATLLITVHPPRVSADLVTVLFNTDIASTNMIDAFGDGFLTLTGHFDIDQNNPSDPAATFSLGTLLVSASDGGLGVQDDRGGGSTGISGQGGNQDESVIFDFIHGIDPSSVRLGLAAIDFLGDDDPYLFVTTGTPSMPGPILTFREADIVANYTGGTTGLLNFAGFGITEPIFRFEFRATDGHSYVSQVTVDNNVVPEPASALLLAVAMLVLALKRQCCLS